MRVLIKCSFVIALACLASGAAKAGDAWIADEDLAELAANPKLRVVDLSHTHITDRGLLYLRPATRVTSLDLLWAEQIGDEGLAYLKDWRALMAINLHGTKITDTATTYLAKMSELVAVDVGFARVTDAGLSFLMRLKKIEALTIGGNRITSTGLQSLRTFATLVTLDLGGQQRTDSGLWSVQIDDDAIAAITSLPKLRRLRLFALPITDAQVVRLLALPTLEQLDLSACPALTDAVLDALVTKDRLKWLNVAGTKLSAKALEQFRSKRPEVVLVSSP